VDEGEGVGGAMVGVRVDGGVRVGMGVLEGGKVEVGEGVRLGVGVSVTCGREVCQFSLSGSGVSKSAATQPPPRLS